MIKKKLNDPLNYLNIEFDTSMESVLGKNYLKGEVISRIIGAASTALDKLSFYLQMVANESSILSAKTFDAVSMLAFNRGYKYRLATAATGDVVFYINSSMDQDIRLDSNLIISNDKGIKYTTLAPVFIKKGELYSKPIPIIQGEINEKEIIVELDDQRIFNLGALNLSEPHIEVYVNNVKYEKIESIFDAESGEKRFELFGLNGEVYLVFGNGVIGSRLYQGDVLKIKYVITDGSLGNTPRNTIQNIISDRPLQVLVTNKQDISGGQDVEDIESIRENAQIAYWTQWQITTSQSAEKVAKLNPYVTYAKGYFNNGTKNLPYKILQVYIGGETGPLSKDVLVEVENFLKERCIEDTLIEVKNLKWKKLDLVINLWYTSKEVYKNQLIRYDLGEIQKEIEENLKKEINPSNYEAGDKIYISKIIDIIHNTQGVKGVEIINYDDVEYIKLDHDTVPIFNHLYYNEITDVSNE